MASHPFVDANKRTALNTTAVFYFLNGYRFTYDREMEPILQRFGIEEGTVEEAETVRYLRSHTEEIDLSAEIDSWREDLLQYGLDELAERSSDPND